MPTFAGTRCELARTIARAIPCAVDSKTRGSKKSPPSAAYPVESTGQIGPVEECVWVAAIMMFSSGMPVSGISS